MRVDDVRYALRALARRPAFTAFAVATLALGIGASTALFAMLDAALLRLPPFPGAEQLDELYLTARSSGHGVERMRWSYPRYAMLRRLSTSYTDITAYGPYEFNLAGDHEAERIAAEAVSASYFRTLGVGAALGRTFAPNEDSATGASAVAVIGFGLWLQRFGGDPAVLGRSVRVNGVDLTVIGVMPRGFAGLTGGAGIWVPSAMVPRLSYADYLTTNQDFISVIARRAPHVELQRARGELTVLGPRIERLLPSETDVPTTFGATAVPLSEARVDPGYRRAIIVLLVAVTFLLLITCTSVAGLELARNAARGREIAVRLAIGAGRPRIVRLLLGESAALSLAGGLGGLAIAAWLPRLVVPPPDVAGPHNHYGQLGQFAAPRLDAVVFAFAAIVVVATTLMSGLVPALTAARTDLSIALKQGSARATRRGFARHGIRAMLVIAQVALAFVLSAGAILALGAVRRAERAPLGIDPAHVLTFRIAPSEVRYPPAAAPALIEHVLAAVSAVPGVDAATVDACAPLGLRCATSTLYVIGRPDPPPGLAPEVMRHYVGPDHLRALGIPLIRGRAFSPADRSGRARVAMINETAARRFWPGQNPIGQRVWFGGGSSFDRPDSSAEIIGVVGDVPYGAPAGGAVPPSFYTPYLQFSYASRMVMVRTHGDMAALVPALRAALHATDPELAMFDVQPMTARLADAWARPRFTGHLLAAFAVLAAALAAAGIYGITMQSVAERRRELGVRVALGASTGRIARLVVGESMALAGLGLAVGSLAALALFAVMRGVIAEMGPADPRVIAALVGAAMITAIGASWAPARRAARTDPAITMRAE